MNQIRHLTMAELEAGLDEIRRSPSNEGELLMIVRRPATLEREILESGELDVVDGLVGDNWKHRRSSRTPDGTPHPGTQLAIMNARAAALVARDKARWPLAGDQLFVDLDLGSENLPPGTRLEIGSSLVEITDQPHTGCAKFVERFGIDALKFVNSESGRKLRLRGLYAKVIRSGVVTLGDVVRKVV